MLDNLGVTIVDNRPKSEFDVRLDKFAESLGNTCMAHGMREFIGIPDDIIGKYLAECFRTLCATNTAVWAAQENNNT